jgi:ring-1,2-phenylacetyl-CoA epoxidase subunit PaaD
VVTAAPRATGRDAREIVASVPDPEMPWVNLGDLGIVRGVELLGPDRGSVRVELTPTYLGCPAVEVMRTDVAAALTAAGYRVESVGLRLDPPWTSAQITEEGRRKLAEAGIAPPAHIAAPQDAASASTPLNLGVRCPNCGGIETVLLSRFGASPCQELRRCSSCAEPFPAVRA